MKLTKKHGIVSENMEYTRMFWSLILPIHHNMKHEMATFCETEIITFTFMHCNVRYRAPGVMNYGSQHVMLQLPETCYAHPLHHTLAESYSEGATLSQFIILTKKKGKHL